jgi:hypothetical protein
MTEVVKHLLGICGDNHPSLLNASPFIIGVIYYFSLIKYKIKSLCNKIKLHI